ncbi:pentatricopeptide repeat-containing protein At3g49740 [Nymphaea colorata]|uniref:Pentacotripeptide-repeat region of PRORP domain-containing protein n=1 Tax=Nymphaea colorata TaxID=210225 RepID=A0A5K1BUF6_9MAGN|nr:pentatricopeptide repeat-containing protein At3g49740 [Nymphaea colorata]
MRASQTPGQALIRLNALISKHARSGQHRDALLLFHHLNSFLQLKPDHYTLASALTACANLADVAAGEQLHAHVTVAGFQRYLQVGNTLIAFYAKSGDLLSARHVFDEIPFRDVFSWTTLVAAHAKSGDVEVALGLLEEMPQRNLVAWNGLITGFTQSGRPEVALQVFKRMRKTGVSCDHYTYAGLLSLCSSQEFICLGRQIHAVVIPTGLLARASVVNAMLTMYFACGMLDDACDMFVESVDIHNQVTFNAMIAGLIGTSKYLEALAVFKEMQEACVLPTESTLVSILSVCSFKNMLKCGMQVHGHVVKMGLEDHVIVCNAAINMYSNCLDLQSARMLFEMLINRDLVSWNSMIAGYGQQKFWKEAMEVFLKMLRSGIRPDEFTYGSILAGFVGFEAQKYVEMVHGLAYKDGLILNSQVCNALTSTYVRCGAIDDCLKLFSDMPERNLISWNVIISAYVQNGLVMEAWDCFYKLQESKVRPNSYTLSIILSTCGCISALRQGQQVHAYILRCGLEWETSLGNALVTMYAKCGCLSWSRDVFYRLRQKDVVSWNAMIAAYAQHGEGEEALGCFETMGQLGILYDQVTFTVILSACSHAGLVDDGCRIFSSMIKDYGLSPSQDHYSCIIDLLGRAGNLDEAKRFIKGMPFEAGSYIWWALLSACRAHGDVRLGEIASKYLLQFEPNNPAVYVLLSNIHASAGQWEDAARVRDLMRENGVVKEPGRSWI